MSHVSRLPRGYWAIKGNQRDFLNSLAKRLNVKSPTDWTKITWQILVDNGASSLLDKYGGSREKLLESVYPDIKWNPEWFSSRGSRKNLQFQKEFMNNLTKIFGLKSLQDWGTVTNEMIINNGGAPILNYYGGSIFKALNAIYPEIEWNPKWFSSRSNWKNWNTQRTFFDNLAKKLNIKRPSDWSRVNKQILIENGAASLLTYHKGSFLHLMESIYPEINWKMKLLRFPKNYFFKESNRRAFASSLSVKYGLHSLSDWRKITLSLIRHHGGSGLLRMYKNSLHSFLNSIFPSLEKKTSTVVSRAQFILKSFLMEFFPTCEIAVNYRHPILNNIELDIWIPEHKLAFEYHGPQHYTQSMRTENDISLSKQNERDQLRRSKCKQFGITLIEIPHWWDEQECKIRSSKVHLYFAVSLLATILSKRPDLKNQMNLGHISSQIERNEFFLKDSVIPEKMPFKDKDFLSIPNIWSGKGDPSGWFVSELVPGKRVYFDGKTFHDIQGEEIKVEENLKPSMNIIYPLDGVLRDSKFYVLDIIANKEPVEKRISFIFSRNIK